MKNSVKLIILLIPAFFFASCSKDNSDLIIGQWKLTKLDYSHISSYSSNIRNFNGSIITINYNGDITTESYSETLTINADGTFENDVISNGLTNKYTGDWCWFDTDKTILSLILYDIDDEPFRVISLTKDQMQMEKSYSYTGTDIYHQESDSRTYTKL